MSDTFGDTSIESSDHCDFVFRPTTERIFLLLWWENIGVVATLQAFGDQYVRLFKSGLQVLRSPLGKKLSEADRTGDAAVQSPRWSGASKADGVTNGVKVLREVHPLCPSTIGPTVLELKLPIRLRVKVVGTFAEALKNQL